jgi:phosphoadenosine phosphosulfate reductase
VRGIELDVAPITNGNGAANGDAPSEGRVDPAVVTAELEGRSAEDVIAWAIETFHPELYFATSFQKTSSVIIDIAQRIEPETRFFYLDTDVLFQETYETRDRLAERYGIEFERYSGISLDEQERVYGGELWNRQPDACCGIRKVEPMREALSGLDCWVSGIRRSDSRTRAGAAKFGWDRRFGLWKLNPLADWSERDVWRYLNDHDVPTLATLRSDARTARARRARASRLAPGAGRPPRRRSAGSTASEAFGPEADRALLTKLLHYPASRDSDG